MTTAKLWTIRGIHALMLVGELILLYSGLSVIFADDENPLLSLLAWNMTAFLYLGLGMVVMRRRSKRSPADRAPEPEVPRGVWGVLLQLYTGFLPAIFSFLGVTAAVIVLADVDSSDPDRALVTKALGSLVMVSAWLLLHVSYARSYRLFYLKEGGGIEFPETPRPGEVDFLYFAMTLGSSFATSDVNITSTRMRWHVLVHSVLSFFYNAIVLAVGFRIITGG